MNIRLNILNELARGKAEITNKIDNTSDNIINYLILCLLYCDRQELNHWKKEIHSFLYKIDKVKGRNKYPSYKKLRKWWFAGFEDTLMDNLDVRIDRIMNEYGQVEYNKNKIYNSIINYFEWLLQSLSEKGSVYQSEVTFKIDELNEDEDLVEMARLGFTADGFEVYVNTDDTGNIPHFHYRTKGTWKFHSCIRIDKAEYFEHEGKEGKLNSKQRKELVKFLQGANKSKGFNTNWERLLADWNANNSNIEVDENQEMPNYLNLK